MKVRISYYAPALLVVLFLAGGAEWVFGQQPASSGPTSVDMTVAKPEKLWDFLRSGWRGCTR